MLTQRVSLIVYKFVSFYKTGMDSCFVSLGGKSPLLCTASPGLLPGAGCPKPGAADVPAPPAQHNLLPTRPARDSSRARHEGMPCGVQSLARSLLTGLLPWTGLFTQAAFTDPLRSFCSSYDTKNKKKSCICVKRNGNVPPVLPSRQVLWPCSNLHLVPSLTARVRTPNCAEFSKCSTYLRGSETG